MKIENGQTKAPHDIHPIHYALHAASAVLVFALCVLADVSIIELRHARQRGVIWLDGGAWHPTNAFLSSRLPITNKTVQIGISDDGYVMWRVIQ